MTTSSETSSTEEEVRTFTVSSISPPAAQMSDTALIIASALAFVVAALALGLGVSYFACGTTLARYLVSQSVPLLWGLNAFADTSAD
jgi:uncharacterized protein HemX